MKYCFKKKSLKTELGRLVYSSNWTVCFIGLFFYFIAVSFRVGKISMNS